MEHILELLGRTWILWLLLFFYLAFRFYNEGSVHSFCSEDELIEREKREVAYAVLALVSLILCVSGVLYRL